MKDKYDMTLAQIKEDNIRENGGNQIWMRGLRQKEVKSLSDDERNNIRDPLSTLA